MITNFEGTLKTSSAISADLERATSTTEFRMTMPQLEPIGIGANWESNSNDVTRDVPTMLTDSLETVDFETNTLSNKQDNGSSPKDQGDRLDSTTSNNEVEASPNISVLPNTSKLKSIYFVL